MADEKTKVDTQTTETGESEVSKIKLGDTEFSQDELQDLVGAGKRLKEIETKQGQPIDEVLTSWGRRGEQIGELKKKVEELEIAQKAPKPQEEIDQEKVKEQVISEAKKFGLLTKDEAQQMFNEVYENRRAGEKILSGISKLNRVAKTDGKPTVDPEKLLEFMADPNNPKDPEKAYKLMFEKELEEWKDKQLSTLKKKPIMTDTSSTAGGKEFKSPSVTRSNITQVLGDYLRSEGSGQ